MNVVKREARFRNTKSKFKNELVRKDESSGIRSSNVPLMSFNTNATRLPVKGPRYQFSGDRPGVSKVSTMGPPMASPRSLKRKIVHSSSTRPESSSSGKGKRVLASDSATETSQDFTTPRNRPALRYISSSSRGGYSGSRSARSTSTSVVEPSVILAIAEGRGMARGEIGMAAIDLKHPHLVLCQFSDTLLYTHTLTKINYFNPVEIIVPHTFCEGVQPSQLYQLIKEQCPLVSVTAVQRRHFNDAAARQHIQSLCAPQYSAVYLQVIQKFYALTAAAAVLKYVEYIQCIVFARESLKIEYHSSENTMIIGKSSTTHKTLNDSQDVGTTIQLELVQPLVPSAGPTCCLLGVLGPTYTVGGIRALRASLLQPSCNKDFIEARLDAVQELIESDDGLMVDLQNVIKKLSDVDKILFLCIETPNQNMDKFGEAQIYQTLLLKSTMEVVPSLVEALNLAESAVLRKIKMELENPHYKEIAERIRSTIQDDAHPEKGVMGSIQRCFAVKPEINGLLDVARRTYSELIEDIQKIVENLSETHELPLRLNQNVMKGFHIVMPVAPKSRRHFNIEDLPPIFIQVIFNGASVTMSTEELVVLDHQAKESLNEIQKMSNIVISGLLKELRPFMSSLYKLCENVAELDILLALAQASSIGSYIRPDFDRYLDIRNSVHPLLDYNSQAMPVPNDIFASPESNFTIITGPNMGGKSIYIKQIAILQIMAQLGCFIPATNAVLRLCDRMFSRIGFNDSVELNASTYVLEMKEIQHILKGLTSSSLVIIDELCRGTCIEEGASICWAICEELLASEAFTFFTTHFMFLTRLQELYYNVVNCHTSVTEEESENSNFPHKRLIYQHKIEPGCTKIEHYGLALAAKTHLPEETVNLAKELAELIGKSRKPEEIGTPIRTDEALLYKLNADVRMEIRKYNNADEYVRRILQKFKDDNPELMQRLLLENRDNSKVSEDKSFEAYSKQETSSYRVNVSTERYTECHDTRTKHCTSNKETPVAYVTESLTRYSRIPSSDSNSLGQIDTNNNEEHTSVKSSTELLNTFTNIERLSINENNQDRLVKHDEYNEIDRENLHNLNDESTGEYEDIWNDKVHNLIDTAEDNEAIDITISQSSNENKNDKMDSGSSGSTESRDIAEELTQIIEFDDTSTHSQTSSQDTNIDEELMTETVNEINEELIMASTSVENIVLTPPLGFQD